MILQILWVDDDHVTCDSEGEPSPAQLGPMGRYVAELLDSGRYKIKVATTADEALESLRHCEFQVAIVDVMLPRSHATWGYDEREGVTVGIKLVCEIHSEWPGLPILMLTSSLLARATGQDSVFDELISTGIVRDVQSKFDMMPDRFVDWVDEMVRTEREL